jgi:hypothetical protein
MRVGVVLLAVFGYFATSLRWIAADGARLGLYPPGSAHDTSERGLSLAFDYLRQRGAGAVALTRSLEAEAPPADAVVFRVRPRAGARRSLEVMSAEQPAQAPRASAALPLLPPAEDDWVRRGGRLVLALDAGYGPLQVESLSEGSVAKSYAVWPGVTRIEPEPLRGLTGPALFEAVSLFVAGERPFASRIRRGAGDVILLAAPEVLENARLARADHLALLLALSAGRKSFFDEHAHGIAGAEGLLLLLARFGFGPLVVLLALLALTLLWRARAVLGPPVDDYRERRSEAVDLVDSLGQLYDRALGRGEALAMYQQALTQAVAARSGLRGEPLRARVHALLGGRGAAPASRKAEPTPADFADRLSRLNDAFRRLSDAHTR